MDYLLEILATVWLVLSGNVFVKVVAIVIIADTVFGLLRAVKERRFNSCFGIDGAIRKIGMIVSIVCLAAVDMLIGFNMLPFVPEEILNHIGITKLGLCEFFCLLYIMYEAVSILKNMCLCGLPIPKRIRESIAKWLHTMTAELDETKRTEAVDNGSGE